MAYIYIYVFIYCVYLCTIPHIFLKLVKVKQCSATVPKPFSKKKKKGYREFFLRIILKTCHYSKTNLKH